jgi:hypothetical protein
MNRREKIEQFRGQEKTREQFCVDDETLEFALEMEPTLPPFLTRVYLVKYGIEFSDEEDTRWVELCADKG